MNTFFGFEDHLNNCWRVINIDKIITIEKKIIKNDDIIAETEVLVFVEFGKDVKTYKLTENQYFKLNNIIKQTV